MDDSELVEFLLNDDFNKEKILLSQSLEEEQKEIIKGGRKSTNDVPDDDQRDTKEEPKKLVKVSKQISHTELEFLDDLDSIIMSTNKNTTGKNKKTDTKKEYNKNENPKKNKKDKKPAKKEEPASKPLSVLEKLNNRLERKSAKKTTVNHNTDSTPLLQGTAQRKIKVGNRTVLVRLQFLDTDTGKVEVEKHFKVRDADSLTLITDSSKVKEPSFTNDETLTELLNPATNLNSKDSFKFNFTETNTDDTVDTTLEEKSSRRKRKGKKNTKNESNTPTELNIPMKPIDIDKTVVEASSPEEDNPKKIKNRKRKERKRKARELTKSKDGNTTSSGNEKVSNKENILPDNNRRDLKESDSTEKENRLSSRSEHSIQNSKDVLAEKASSDKFKRTTIEF